MSSIEIRLIVYVLLFLGAVAGVRHYNDLTARAALSDVRGSKIERTDKLIEQGENADAQRVEVEVKVAESRSGYQAATRAAPELADRRNQPVADSLRRLAKERRLARERSSRFAGDDAQATRAKGDGERKDVLP